MQKSRTVLACLVFLAAGAAEAQSLTEQAAREKKRREALGPAKGPVYNSDQVGSGWTGWRDFRPRDGGFVVQFPAKPTFERGEFSLGGSYPPAVRNTYRSEDVDGALFVVTYTEYPAAFLRASPDGPFPNFYEPPRRADSFMDSWPGALSRRPAVFMAAHYSVVATCLIGSRFYELSFVFGRGDGGGHGRRGHPFFDSFAVE